MRLHRKQPHLAREASVRAGTRHYPTYLRGGYVAIASLIFKVITRRAFGVATARKNR